MAFPRFIWNDRVEALASGSITSSSAATDYPDDNVKDRREYTQWKPTGAAPYWIMFDFGAPVQVQALGLAGHSLGSNACLNITLNADNAGAGHPLANNIVPAFSPSNDRAIAKFFNSSYRYWELYIPNATAAPEIGVLFLAADYLQWPNPVESPFDGDAVKSYHVTAVGDSGHLLGTIQKFKQRMLNITFNYLTPTWVQTYFWPFFNSNGYKPFFFVWDYDNRPDEISYVRMSNNQVTAPREGVFQGISLDLTGLWDAQ